MIKYITKRDGTKESFNPQKITNSIFSAGKENGIDFTKAMKLTSSIEKQLAEIFKSDTISSEQLCKTITDYLAENGDQGAAKSFILYNIERSKIRLKRSDLVRSFGEIMTSFDNGNATSREIMHRFSMEGVRLFNELFLLKPEYSKAHYSGDINIHDLEYAPININSCQIGLAKIMNDGFARGETTFLPPFNLAKGALLTSSVIFSCHDDQHGTVTICDFDYAMAECVKNTFITKYYENLRQALDLKYNISDLLSIDVRSGGKPSLNRADNYYSEEFLLLSKKIGKKKTEEVQEFAFKHATLETDNECLAAMDKLLGLLSGVRNNSKFSICTINYGLDTSNEGRMVIKNMLTATEIFTSRYGKYIFPITMFKVKSGINGTPGDPNYDLCKLAVRVGTKRHNVSFSFLDSGFNERFFQPKNPQTEVAYSGYGERVFDGAADANRPSVYGLCNISTTTINLVRAALRAHKNVDRFFQYIDNLLELCYGQLKDRLELLIKKSPTNYPYMFGQNFIAGCTKENCNCDIFKHGTLNIGFIGLNEAIKALTGLNYFDNKSAQELGIKIIKFMYDKVATRANESGFNYQLVGTTSDNIDNRFERLDRKSFGTIGGINEQNYTNSFHTPPSCSITAEEKIAIEAPMHALTLGGHIFELPISINASYSDCERLLALAAKSGIGCLRMKIK